MHALSHLKFATVPLLRQILMEWEESQFASNKIRDQF